MCQAPGKGRGMAWGLHVQYRESGGRVAKGHGMGAEGLVAIPECAKRVAR